MGWSQSTGMGLSPLSFTEIKAYMELTASPLTPDEVLLIRKMSQAYVSNVQNRDPQTKPPYGVTKTSKNNSFVEAIKQLAKMKK
jgi:hypothetical protein